MATTTKTAKKTSARKPAARKPAARKPAAKKAAAKKPAAKQAETKHLVDMPDMEEVADRFEDVLTDAMKLVRDAAHASIGAGLVVQDRLAHRDMSMISYNEFLDQAKAKGEVRMTEIQDRFEPIVQRVTDRFEPVTEKIEARLPEQVKDVIENGRERVRHVFAA